MTKKHFERIAAMIKCQLLTTDSELESEEQKVISRIARNLAFEFSLINSRFNITVFYEACGLDGNGYLL